MGWAPFQIGMSMNGELYAGAAPSAAAAGPASIRDRSASTTMPSSRTSPGVAMPVTPGSDSAHETAAVMLAWSSNGSYQVA